MLYITSSQVSLSFIDYSYLQLADINNGCKVTVVYESPEDGLVKAETYVGIKE
jgi:hypothetical protein